MNFCTLKRYLLLLFIALYSKAGRGLDSPASQPEDGNGSSELTAFQENNNYSTTNCIIKPPLCHYDSQNGHTLLSFCINDDFRNILTHPNKIKQIILDNHVLVFDDNAALPNPFNWPLIDVYSCDAYGPALIRFRGSYGYGLYSVDSVTGKWNNHAIANLKDYEEINENGFISYKIGTNQSIEKIFDEINNEWTRLTEALCASNNNISKTPENVNFEIHLHKFENDENNGKKQFINLVGDDLQE